MHRLLTSLGEKKNPACLPAIKNCPMLGETNNQFYMVLHKRGLMVLSFVPCRFKILCRLQRRRFKQIDFKRTSNEDVIVFGMDHPCEMEIKSGTNEDLRVYRVQALDVQSLVLDAIGKIIKIPFLRASYVRKYQQKYHCKWHKLSL